MSNAVVPIEARAISGITKAEETWNAEHRAAVARYLGVEPDNPALLPMLAVCAAWGLDPFAGQVWLIKQKGRDASGAEHWRPAAGRDGYLAIANRQVDFRGVQGDVVREGDHYAVTWETTPEGMFPVIHHAYEQGPGQGTGNASEPKVRGGVVGAWSILFRDGRLPVYYFAPWAEHRRDPEKSAWSYKSAMILKAAHSMVLRLGYSITGLVPVDEMRAGLPSAGGEDIDMPEAERPWEDDDLPWGENEDLAKDLRLAVQASWYRGDRQWTRARLSMLLTGDREALLTRIQESVPPFEEEPGEGMDEEEIDGEPVA